MTAKTKPRTRAGRLIVPAAALSFLGAGAPALAGPTINVGEQSYITVSYALQVWMQNRGYTSSSDSGDITDFFLRRNRLTFAGQYNDLVGFYVQLDAASDSKGGEDDKSVFYRDGYVTLDFSDPLRVIVGRFKNTFTRENLEACLEPLTLDRAEVIAYTPFAGSRDTGVALWGNLADGHFQYRLMAADGREGADVVEDSPRWTARVHWSFFDPEVEYGYLGTYLGTKRVLTVGAAYDYQAKVAYSDAVLMTGVSDYKATTVDVFYEQPTASGTYTFSAAGMDYSVDDAINGPSPDANLPVTSELEAWYAKVGYLFPNKIGMGRLQLFARYEDSQYNLLSGLRDHTWSGVGANYYLDGQRLKVTFEYADIEFDHPHPSDPSLQDYKQATLGLQLIF
jgi:hypothetical protein